MMPVFEIIIGVIAIGLLQSVTSEDNSEGDLVNEKNDETMLQSVTSDDNSEGDLINEENDENTYECRRIQDKLESKMVIYDERESVSGNKLAGLEQQRRDGVVEEKLRVNKKCDLVKSLVSEIVELSKYLLLSSDKSGDLDNGEKESDVETVEMAEEQDLNMENGDESLEVAVENYVVNRIRRLF